MIIVGDIGNTETKICLINFNNKIIKRFNLKSKDINFSMLKRKFKKIKTYDPYLDSKIFKNLKLIRPTEIKKQDIFIILNNHDKFNKLKNFMSKRILINPFI